MSTSAVALAAPIEETEKVIDVEGIEQFFSKNDDGTMSMDAKQAREAGYSEYTIQFVQSNIDGINEAVRTQGAVIDDDFKATIYFSTSRARGQSKVETWATGMVLVYMNNAEADDLYNTIDNLGWLGTLAGLAGLLTVSKPIISQACGISSFVAAVAIGLYKAQINQVKKNGTGIIMYVAPLPNGGSSVTFGAQ